MIYKNCLKIFCVLVLFIPALNCYGYYVVEHGKNVTVSAQKADLIDDVEIKDGESLSHKQIIKIVNSKNSDAANQGL